jgi:hypothetical protein
VIGWTSRNTRSRERRAHWWASLTDDQKALERRRDKVENRWAAYGFTAIFAYLILVWAAAPREWAQRHPHVYIALMSLGHPGGLAVLVFVLIHKKRQVK